MQPQLGIRKRFIRSLSGVDRCSLSWGDHTPKTLHYTGSESGSSSQFVHESRKYARLRVATVIWTPPPHTHTWRSSLTIPLIHYDQLEFLTLVGDSLQYLRWYTAVERVHYNIIWSCRPHKQRPAGEWSWEWMITMCVHVLWLHVVCGWAIIFTGILDLENSPRQQTVTRENHGERVGDWCVWLLHL